MSNRRARTKQRTLERAATGTYGGGYGGTQPPGNYVALPASILQQIINNFAPQKDKSNLYSPGAPLQPIPGITPLGGPRQWSYPIGTNVSGVDRSLGLPDIPSFQQLRSLAKLYSGITLCERAWFDLVPKMQLKISLRPDLVAQGMEESKYQKQISNYLRFFEKPDRQNDLHSWLRMALREQTQLDALVFFKHLTKGKALYALELVAGETIKPLLDERGMVPQPPFPAYQQFPYGVPGGLFTTDQMVYYRESPAADTPYGFSRVERIILEVNQALRKKRKDLARFTEGNVPQGIMEVPESSNWTPDQIDTYEQLWNALLAGNAQQQVRVKFTQPGMKYTRTDSDDIQTPFDSFLLNTAVASYGLSMGDLGFTEDIHKSSGDSQQNMLYRRTIDPLAMIYAWILTSIIQTHQIGDNPPSDLFMVSFTGFDEAEDMNALATAYSTLTGAGILGLSNAGKLMHLPEDPDASHIGRVFLSKDGPVFLDDMASDKMRNAAAQAKLEGFKMAANPPQAQPTPQGGADNGSNADDTGDEDDMDQAMDEADQAVSSLDASPKKRHLTLVERQMSQVLERVEEMSAFLVRYDPVRGPGGEFGDYAGKAVHGGKGHHHGHTGTHHGKHGKRLPLKERMAARMAKLAARFAKLAARPIGPNWTAAQAKAAGQLAHVFSQIASGIHAGGQSEKIDGLLDKAWSLTKSVFGGNQKSLAVMSHALTRVDKANDKGLFRFVADEFTDDEEEEPAFDALDLILDALDKEENENDDEEPYQTPETRASGSIWRASGVERGVSETASGQASVGASLAVAERVDPADASSDYRRWRARALEDVKAGKAQRGFTTTLIPQPIHAMIASGLERCATVDEVRQVFEQAKEHQALPRYNENHDAAGRFAEGGGHESGGGGSSGGGGHGGGSAEKEDEHGFTATAHAHIGGAGPIDGSTQHTVTVVVAGYEHQLTDAWVPEDIHTMLHSDYATLISGSEEHLSMAEDMMSHRQDTSFFYTDAGEMLMFHADEMTAQEENDLTVLADVNYVECERPSGASGKYLPVGEEDPSQYDAHGIYMGDTTSRSQQVRVKRSGIPRTRTRRQKKGRALERDYNPVRDVWEPDDIEQQITLLRNQGVTHVTWATTAPESGVLALDPSAGGDSLAQDVVSKSGPCDMCQQNNGQTVKLGEEFLSGHRLPPGHPHCDCTVSATRVSTTRGAT